MNEDYLEACGCEDCLEYEEEFQTHDKKMYTVTAIGRYFVNASDEDEAINIVYESMLGNDHENVLCCGEVNLDYMFAKRGVHSLIKIEGEENGR